MASFQTSVFDWTDVHIHGDVYACTHHRCPLDPGHIPPPSGPCTCMNSLSTTDTASVQLRSSAPWPGENTGYDFKHFITQNSIT